MCQNLPKVELLLFQGTSQSVSLPEWVTSPCPESPPQAPTPAPLLLLKPSDFLQAAPRSPERGADTQPVSSPTQQSKPDQALETKLLAPEEFLLESLGGAVCEAPEPSVPSEKNSEHNKGEADRLGYD